MDQITVLLVDDEPEFLEALAERMTARGLRVETVGSGEEALDRLARASFDAIVLDMLMPGLDGLETLKRLKAAHPEAQVIFLTGQASLAKGIEAVKLGAADFLEKPVELDNLLAKIQEAAGKKLVLVQKTAEAAVKDLLKRRRW
jgi:DNA-binding NtrC family response regulator